MDLGTPRRIWAISAIHGEIERLTALHDDIYPHILPGDRVVYLGNYFGFGHHAVEVIDELLTFRRSVLAKRGMMAEDIVYLRGSQEEMLQKLLQLQFAPDPGGILLWMLGNGLMSTLYSYGVSPHDGIECCRQGVIGLARWTGTVREAIRKRPGHEIFNTRLHRAAHTSRSLETPILFVNSGLRTDRPMEEQGDSFWWANREFEQIQQPYSPFAKVVRGYDPDHKGVNINCITATIDGGCGFGGALVCTVFDGGGAALDTAQF
jgi:hypothetical protein